MSRKVIKQHLKYFIEPHPSFKGSEEQIFTPRNDYVIKFWIEGGFEIAGAHSTLEINFNSNELLVLAVRNEPIERIIRIPWKRIIAFELIINDKSGVNTSDPIYLKPEQKN
ncbi:hypothetical protein [Pedobacter sp. UC225_65]|uniref:hypothetical protein n=1 Tax=Pedobacter sp. UC225_65 TaxID=3350173 RepID=UPI0036709439